MSRVPCVGSWGQKARSLAVILALASMVVGCVTNGNDPGNSSDVFFKAKYDPLHFSEEACLTLFKNKEKFPKYVFEKQGYFSVQFKSEGFSDLTIKEKKIWADLINQVFSSLTLSDVKTIAVTADVSVGDKKILILPLFVIEQANDNEAYFRPISSLRDFGPWLIMNESMPVEMKFSVRYAQEVDSRIFDTMNGIAQGVVAIAGGGVGGSVGALGLSLLSEKAEEWDSQLEAVLSEEVPWKASDKIRLVGDDPLSDCPGHQRGGKLTMTGNALSQPVVASLLLEFRASKLIPIAEPLTEKGLPNFSGYPSEEFPRKNVNLPPNRTPRSFYAEKSMYNSFRHATAATAADFGDHCEGLVDILVTEAELSRYDAIAVLHGELVQHRSFGNSQQLIESQCLQRYGADMAATELPRFKDVPPAKISAEEQLKSRNDAMSEIAVALKERSPARRVSGLINVMSDRVDVFDQSGITDNYGGVDLGPVEAASIFVNVEANHFGCYWWPESSGNSINAIGAAFFSVKDSPKTYFITATFEVIRDSGSGNPIGKIAALNVTEGNKWNAKRVLLDSYGPIGPDETADKYTDCVFYAQRGYYTDFNLSF